MAVDQPDEDVIEATLAADGDQTVLVWEERGVPVDQLAGYGAGAQIHVEDLAAYLAWAWTLRCSRQVRRAVPCLSAVGRRRRLAATQTTRPDAGLGHTARDTARQGGAIGSGVMAFLGRLRSWWNKDAVELAEEETRMTQAERDSAEQDYQARKDDSAVRQRPLGGDTDYERDSEPPRP